jgi:hypothetical protein
MKPQLFAAALSITAAVPVCASELCPFTGTIFADAWAPTFGDAGRFGRSEAGELSGDGVPDALLFDGDRPVLLIDPDQYYAPIELPLSATDGSILRALDGCSRGSIALVGPSGLQLASFDPADAHFDISLVQATTWAGAKLVRCADLDGAGGEDVIALGADRRSLLRLMRVGPASFTPAPTLHALADVLDIVPLQWDLDPAAEMAVLTSAGLQVYDDTGAVLAAWSSALPGGTITRVHEARRDLDRLVWITAYAPPAQQWLLTVSSVGFDSWLDLGALDAVACIGADFDADGDDDLLISHRYSLDLVWIENARSDSDPDAVSFTNSTARVKLFRVGPCDLSATDNSAWPALADFDGDGDLDVVFGVECTAEVQTIRGDWTHEADQQVSIAAASYGLVQAGGLTLQLSPPHVVAAGATSLEVDLRRRSAVGAAIEDHAIQHLEIPLPSQWPAAVTLAIPETQISFTNIYDVQLRLVTRDAAGMRTHVFPTTAASFAMQNSVVTELLSAPEAGDPILVDAILPQDAALKPTVVPSIRLHHYAENKPPLPPIQP